MQTVGIIGGIAPESTIQYYRLIIKTFREQKADGSYPPVVINSIDMQHMLALIGAQRLDEVTAYLAGEVQKLAWAGADFGLMASNTPHIVFERVQQASPIPLISIVAAACDKARAMGMNRVGLFGTRFTMQARFYPETFAAGGIELVTPEPAELDYIHEKYMGELVNGIFLPETRVRLLEIAAALRARSGIDVLVLGGTELPLILESTPGQPVPFLDTTSIHGEQVVARMLA